MVQSEHIKDLNEKGNQFAIAKNGCWFYLKCSIFTKIIPLTENVFCINKVMYKLCINDLNVEIRLLLCIETSALT